MFPILSSDASRSRLIARVVLGLVILPHGLQKTVGLFGGGGFSNTLDWMTSAAQLPTLVALLVILAESVGAIALVAGFLARPAAFLIAATMAGAAITQHASHGFFMNWFGNQGGEGFEFHLLALGLAIPVVLDGAGAWSVDRWLAARLASVRRLQSAAA